MSANILFHPDMRVVEAARIAALQGCVLVGRPGHLSMERAIKGIHRSLVLIDAGLCAEGMVEFVQARDAFEAAANEVHAAEEM